MTWDNFLGFAGSAMVCWLAAATLVYAAKKNIVNLLMMAGIIIFSVFITGLWIGQERPPLRTLGETRLWYSFFIVIVGFITYKRWKYKWLLSFSVLMACIFTCINLINPEIHSKNLMPALQSYWFVPHVTVYILSYAMFAAATIAALVQWSKTVKGQADKSLYYLIDNLVYIGFGFLMLGMLMGSLWAKDVWGHYWSWDPKETWAFITAAAYLLYIHLRKQKTHPRLTLVILPIAFLLLMITWIGVNYLPSAQGSIHVY